MRERQKKRQFKAWQENEAKWAKMERNQHRNTIISLIIFIIMVLVVIYRKIVGA